jgi:hypothetical protein
MQYLLLLYFLCKYMGVNNNILSLGLSHGYTRAKYFHNAFVQKAPAQLQ